MTLQTMSPSVFQGISLLEPVFEPVRIPHGTQEQQHIKHCWKCRGLLKRRTMIEMQTGIFLVQFVCRSCGRPWPAGVKLRSRIRLSSGFSEG